MNILCSGYQADYSFLKTALSATDGNLASHLRVLESAGYVDVSKRFLGRRPNTLYAATPAGKKAYEEYSRVMAPMLERGKPIPPADDPPADDSPPGAPPPGGFPTPDSRPDPAPGR
ncbi:MAG: transcriptional regulator [Bacillota bacterium]|nr:transcriptional regulator [Bacillota bacterium]